jgi:hypothetical protein
MPDPKTAFGLTGLLGGLKVALAKRVLNAEMDHHLATVDNRFDVPHKKQNLTFWRYQCLRRRMS